MTWVLLVPRVPGGLKGLSPASPQGKRDSNCHTNFKRKNYEKKNEKWIFETQNRNEKAVKPKQDSCSHIKFKIKGIEQQIRKKKQKKRIFESRISIDNQPKLSEMVDPTPIQYVSQKQG